MIRSRAAETAAGTAESPATPAGLRAGPICLRVLLTALLLLACAVPARAQDEADHAWAAGDLPAAERLYEARLAADAADATALHRIALIRAWAERYDESLALFDRLLQVDPRNREARVDRARVLAWRGDPAAASLALDPLLAEDPGFLPALQARAQFESWVGNYDEALATYGRIQEITPDDRTVGLGRARVLSWASRFDAAVAAYDSLLRVNPRDTEALVGLGTVLAWASELDSAEAVYRRILELEPGNVEAQRGLARAAGWGGRLVPAERRWREVIARHPDDAASWVGLSQTLRWQGRDAAALDAARRALAIAPTDKDAREALRWARLAVSPRTSASYVNEWDSDGSDIHTSSASAAVRPAPSVEVRMDLYHRTAHYEPNAAVGLRGRSNGGALTLWTMIGTGWGLSGTAGASVPDVRDDEPIPTYRASLSSPGRYPIRGSVSYAHYAMDATAILIEREVYLDEWSAFASWTPARGWTIGGGGGTALFTGRATGEENRRVNGSLNIARRVSRPVTLGVGARFFGFDRDLNEGYFDPDFYGLAEVTARWLREWRHWSLDAELAPGVQQVRSSGDPSGSFRGSGSVAYLLAPGRRIVLTGVFANTGLTQIAPGAGADYRYRAVNIAAQWTF
ncbi:MAG TPA: tetratricopeptide repeat protein [Longimicrobium sp.]